LSITDEDYYRNIKKGESADQMKTFIPAIIGAKLKPNPLWKQLPH